MKHCNKAIFIIEPGFVSAAVVDAWLKSGGTIAAFFTSDTRLLHPKLAQRLEMILAGLPDLYDITRKYEIPVFQTGVNTDDACGRILFMNCDTLFTVMTHFIVPSNVLEKFGRRAVNIHPALLPDWKGARPVQAMLMDGTADLYGGVSAHMLTDDIDGGAIIGVKKVPFSQSPSRIAWALTQARAAADLVSERIVPYLDQRLDARPQVPGSGFYRKSGKMEFLITPDKTLKEVEALFSRLSDTRLRVRHREEEAKRETYVVAGVSKLLGDPTGAPPKVGRWYAEMDIADKRIRLKRRSVYGATLGHPLFLLLCFRIGKRT